MSVWNDIAAAAAAEFGDLSPVPAVRLAVRLLVAGLLGALIGGQRARSGKAAGLRTHILVAVGSAGFIAIPQQSGMDTDAISRILQGLIAGIGFLGAGCIVKAPTEGQVQGLTTAAGIWLTACIGTAAGLGRDTSAIMIAVIGWVTLALLGRIEHVLDNHDVR